MYRPLPIALLACTALAACAGPEAPSTTPKSLLDVEAGRIRGDVRFSNASGVIAGYLASHPVVFSGDPLVSAENTANPIQRSEGPYAAPSSLGASAQYDLAVPLGAAANTAYRVVLDSLIFQSSPSLPIGWLPFPSGLEPPSYRFGSAVLGASNSYVAVLEEVAGEPPGATLDLLECGALVQVRVRLTGAEADLDALSPSPGSIVCAVRALIEDVPFSNTYTHQATSDAVPASLSALRNQGVLVPVLARGDGSRVRIEVACAAETIQTGFAQPPLLPAGWTAFGAGSEEFFLDCDEEVEVPVDVPVERTAGLVRGMFDVVGHDESHAQVRVHELQGYVDPSPTAPADEVLDAADSASYWEFEAVPAGERSFQAEAVLNGGLATLHTPRTENPNDHVLVSTGATIDLGATFVADPHRVLGELRILDPHESDLDMRLFSNPPFNSLSRHLHSHAEGQGLSSLSTLPGGASGVGGTARALLAGSFNTTTREALLDYELLLFGLSPVAGAVDGVDAAPTPWRLRRLLLYFEGESAAMPGNELYQRVDLAPAYNVNLDAIPGGETEVPRLDVCMGHVSLELRLAPGIGQMSRPRLEIESSPVTAPTFFDPPGYSHVSWGEVRGVPSEVGLAATEGVVAAVLPEGIQYTVHPKLDLVAADGSVSTMSLAPIQLPLGGPVTCGGAVEDCATVLENGDLVITSPSIQPGILCQTDTELTVAVAGTAEIEEVTYVLEYEDGTTSTPTVVCSNGCGVAPTLIVPVDLNGVEAVRVRVVDEYGCDPEAVGSVQPGLPTLECPDELIVVQLEPGELNLEADDPRIADQLAPPPASGPCTAAIPLTNDAPETFPVGSTSVTFFADGVAVCESTVRVVLPVQLAYVADGIAWLHRVGGGVELSHELTEPATVVDFDRAGRFLGVGGYGPDVALIDVDNGVNLAQLLGFEGNGPASSIDVRNVAAASMAIGYKSKARLAGVGVGAQQNVLGAGTLVDYSDDGEHLIAAGVSVEFGTGAGFLQAYRITPSPFEPELMGDHPFGGSPLGMRHVATTDSGTVLQLATTEGLYTFAYDADFVADEDEEVDEEWEPGALSLTNTEAQAFYRVDFGEQTADGLAASWVDGAVGVLHQAIDDNGQPLPELDRSLISVPQGYYEVGWSLEHRLIAIAGRVPEHPQEPESKIEIYSWVLNGTEIEFVLVDTIPVEAATSLTFRPGPH